MHYYVTDNRAACMPLNEFPPQATPSSTKISPSASPTNATIGHYFALPDGDVAGLPFCLLLDDTEYRVLVASYAIGHYDTPLLPLPRYGAITPSFICAIVSALIVFLVESISGT